MALNLQFRVTKPGSRITSKDEAGKRLNDAVKAYEDAEGSLSITQAAYVYAVSKATLYCRINSCRNQGSYGISKQRLTPEEEESIKNWVLKIQSWGYFPRVVQLREMAVELLQAKSDHKKKSWVKIGFQDILVVIRHYKSNTVVLLIKTDF